MLNEIIKEKMFNEMLERANHNINTCRIKEGVITTSKNYTGGIDLNGKYYLSIPEEIEINEEKIKLHGNTRNCLAKEFISRYTYKDIQKNFENYIELENKKINYQNTVAKKLIEELNKELSNVIPSEIIKEKKIYINHSLNVFEIEYELKSKQKGFYELLKVYKCYNNDLYSTYFFDKRLKLTKSEILNKLKKKYL